MYLIGSLRRGEMQGVALDKRGLIVQQMANRGCIPCIR